MKHRKKKQIVLVLTVLIFIFTGCTKEKELPQKDKPQLTTSTEVTISLNSAIIGGRIVSDGGASIEKQGVCWSLTENPTIETSNVAYASAAKTEFSIKANQLGLNTTIYARAFAINEKGISYGNQISFVLWFNYPREQVKDIDNNTYNSVQIGNQIWLTENLTVTHYQNGDPINKLTIKDDNEWLTKKEGAFCSYNDKEDSVKTTGYLYNGYAVKDKRKICPKGWHIPSQKEWEELINYLGGDASASDMLRSGSEWKDHDSFNYSGFTAVPTGLRWHSYSDRTLTSYACKPYKAFFWTNTEQPYDASQLWSASITSKPSAVAVASSNPMTSGLSIRCIKD